VKVVRRTASSARLAKSMKAAGHQRFERGDLLALTYDDPAQEARAIADRIQQLQGVPFQDAPDAPERGLSYADCAVLFRSVRHDAGPLVEELRRRGIPYIIKGLVRLFETPEVQAAVACFRYVAGLIDAEAVKDAWRAADVGCDERLDQGIAVLDEAIAWDESRPWDSITLQGVFLGFLEAIGLREENVPSHGETDGGRRGEPVFCNLGRFSTAIGDYEAIHLTVHPKERFEKFAKWLQYQAPGYYEEFDGDNGYAQPDAVVIATEELVDRHLNLPFANPAAKARLRPAAIASVRRYLREKGATLRQTMFSEQPVEIHPAPGVTVTGRVDLIKRLDTEEVSVVDFKSSERAQAEDVSLAQLHLYALGYRELTGADADLVEVHNLDEEGSSLREEVDTGLLNDLTRRVTEVGRSLRDNDLRRLPRWCATCTSCDFAGICRDGTDTSG